ncbi:hypothetical protein RB195_007124 [Necator americanus]|uniref:Uncharacterized protein n=1 Tax=Necator americanus TaxID=51031 RepID=A0ABR1BVR3_NECAM
MIRSFGDDDDGVPVFEAVNKDFALASFQASHRDNAMQWDVSSDLTHRAAIHNRKRDEVALFLFIFEGSDNPIIQF